MIRVLHVIDTLGGGGSERILFNTVRYAGPEFVHQIATLWPDDGTFVYAAALQQRSAYDWETPASANENATGSQQKSRLELAEATGRRVARILPNWLRSRLNSFWYHSVWLIQGWLRARQAFREFRPDVIQGHLVKGATIAILLGISSGRPVIIVPACLSEQLPESERWFPRLLKLARRQIDLFVAGVGLATELVETGIPQESIRTFNGIIEVSELPDPATPEFARHRLAVRQELGLRADAKVLLSVGRLHESKGHLLAVEALSGVARNVPESHWIVLGQGPLKKQIIEQIAALGMCDRVTLLGFREDFIRYYAAADIYLRTGIVEGDNMSSCYAMAAGIAVVGFDTQAITDFMPNAKNGVLVPNCDAESLREAILALLADDAARLEYGRRGREFAQRKLDFSEAIGVFEAAYREVVKRDAVELRQDSSAGT